MRIVHTSDWHAGRIWKSQNRLDELRNVLEHLGDFVERERIDLLLMSGDIFESQMPSAEAERAVSTFFKRLGRADVPSVVIAGNHDHPTRLDTWGLLAEFVGVQARGLPRRRQDGGLIEISTRCGDRALVAALPWAPPGRIVEALTLARDETQARQQYADAMQQILAHLAEGFQSGRREPDRGALAHRGREGLRLGARGDDGGRLGGDAHSRCRRRRSTSRWGTSIARSASSRPRRTPSTRDRRCSSTSARWARRRASW